MGAHFSSEMLDCKLVAANVFQCSRVMMKNFFITNRVYCFAYPEAAVENVLLPIP